MNLSFVQPFFISYYSYIFHTLIRISFDLNHAVAMDDGIKYDEIPRDKSVYIFF